MTDNTAAWAVIGAGPAGIAAVGKLLDANIAPNDIMWFDPAFQVGDLGQLWQNASSNTSVKLFLSFLHGVASFGYHKAPDFPLNHLAPHATCTLSRIVEPLQWVTNHLKTQVKTYQTTIHQLHHAQRTWVLKSHDHTFHAKQVILATGSVPETLPYPIKALPFEIAINPVRLAQSVNRQHTYGVFGSSHSAIMIMHHLVDLGVKKIINFYRSPCRYAVHMGDWILFDNTGLKGESAAWARAYIDGDIPNNISRYLATEAHISRYLSHCDEVIFAVGFKPRTQLLIEDYHALAGNPHVGILAPGLFGVGIAYPELVTDPYGNREFNVGLWKFLNYLNKVMPLWFQYPA